jgi:hypothetical protein
MANINDPNQLIAAGTAAADPNTDPYNPLVSDATAANPYTGEQDSQADIVSELNYNTIYDPQYFDPDDMTQTYTPIDPNAPGTTQGYQGVDPNGISATTPVTQAQATYANVDGLNQAVNNYTATTMTAAQGTVDPNSMVQNQMDQILNSGDANNDGIPDWSEPAVTAARQQMNAMGLGASTMAGNATTTAILNAAMPMAMANAQVVAQLNSQNLSNQQQAMLSNAAWDNAAKQFNAQSANQMREFFASLTADIAKFNADKATAVSMFNAKESNGMAQFLANLANQRELFNVQNALLVDQANVQWRRAVNTANTAGVNAVNQANAANMFGMSMQALNNLWQQSRDEASWALTAQENSSNRWLSLVNSALNRSTSLQILASTLNANMFSQLGGFATNLLGGSFGSSIIDGLFGNSSTNNGVSSSVVDGLTDADWELLAGS